MRHPAAPQIVAVLLCLLAALYLWGKLLGGGHHEGNPHPDDVPQRAESEDEAEDVGGGGEET